ncbi:MAG TPA: lamin tail domain-containing protein, partial [Chloroflexota bacterium]|nr:lamin tail domain-containing protein [Chloroflexota bacterium]
AWDTAARRRYANVLTDATHLIAVTKSANRSKGAKSPDQWKPPNREYWCTYATDWIGIKTTWSLTVTPAEAEALTVMLETCGTAVIINQSPTPAPPIPNPTPEPTLTPAPEPTPAPTPSSEPGFDTGFEIVALDCNGKPESVTIRNTEPQTASLDNWSIHDEGEKHIYMFPTGTSVEAGATISVWTWTGAAEQTVYWKGSAVWNNDGDIAFLLNPAGTIVSQRACD